MTQGRRTGAWKNVRARRSERRAVNPDVTKKPHQAGTPSRATQAWSRGQLTSGQHRAIAEARETRP